MSKILEIVVSPTGVSRAETKGFAGGGCRAASAFLEETLGRKTGEWLTAEFYLSAEQPQATRQQN